LGRRIRRIDGKRKRIELEDKGKDCKGEEYRKV
jgi:hypothetical protein